MNVRITGDVIITEKIDGVNGMIVIDKHGGFSVGSRTRILQPGTDSTGFARWAYNNKESLMDLGPGIHVGEWWGKDIERGYGIEETRFSLLDIQKWGSPFNNMDVTQADNTRCVEVPVCHVVPRMHTGEYSEALSNRAVEWLGNFGSFAARGYMNPEGIVIYHIATARSFTRLLP